MSQQRAEQLNERWLEAVDRVQAFVAARVGDRELAADITHDVLVRSIASGALDEVDNPAAWLYRSARNAVIDHYRTRREHLPLGDEDVWPDPDTSGDAPNDATRELARCLQPMLEGLPASAREALTRIDLEGQTHRAAAAELGLSVSGMKSRVQRARRQLKEVLQRCCAVRLDRTGAVAGYHPTGQSSCGCGEAATAGV